MPRVKGGIGGRKNREEKNNSPQGRNGGVGMTREWADR